MINKINYKNSDKLPDTQGPSTDLVDKESATEDGSRGINLIEMTSDFDVVDPDIYEQEKGRLSNQIPLDENVMELLVSLGDTMDENNEEALANFTDFLIQKFAETKSLDFSILFNKLMIKVNNADLVNTNEIIKKLTKIYSRTFLLEYYQNGDLVKSKESAYKKTLHRADQYLSEG